MLLGMERLETDMDSTIHIYDVSGESRSFQISHADTDWRARDANRKAAAAYRATLPASVEVERHFHGVGREPWEMHRKGRFVHSFDTREEAFAALLAE